MPVVWVSDPRLGISGDGPKQHFRAPSASSGDAAVPESRAFTLARVCLLVLLFGAPLAFGAVQPWAWATAAAVCFLVLLLWAIGCLGKGTVTVYWSPFYVVGLAVLLLGLVQYFARLTLDPVGSRESLLKFATDLSFFFLAVQFVGGACERIWRRVGLTVAIYAFLISLLAIIQYFSSPDRIYWTVTLPAANWSFGPYVNHNHYAGLMEMLIPLALGYWFTLRKGNPLRILLGLPLLLPIVSVLLCASRGGLIALSAEGVLLSVVLFKLARSHGRRPIRPASVLVAVAVVVAGCIWIVPGDNLTRLETLFQPRLAEEIGFGNRAEVALDSLRILRDHPWAGTGLGSFKTAYSQYQSFPDDLLWDHAHNDYAEALAETGFLGGSLIVAAMVLFLGLSFSGLLIRLTDGSGWMPFGAALGCCGLLVHSFFDFNLHLPANALWFAFCLALAATAWTPSRLPEGSRHVSLTNSRLDMVGHSRKRGEQNCW